MKPTPKKDWKIFLANLLNALGMNISKPVDCIGNEPTLDIHIGHFGQDINIQNYKYMPFEMNMLIMCHVHHLST